MAEKVTIMVLKVDLQCFKCYKKVKKVLCKFPQIRDQVYDEKANAVTITVICCSPEKIRDKLCSKGGGSIKSIEIKPPPKPKEPKEAEKKAEKPKEAEKKVDKPKEADKKADKPKEDEKKADKPKEGEKKADKPKEAEKPKDGGEKPKEAAPKAMEAAPLPPMTYAVGYSYMDGFHHGYGGGGPSYYGGPPQQPFQNYETIGRPVYDNWGSGGGGYYRHGYGGRGGEYFSDENPQECSIM